ncbi:hypothetical protein V6C32_10795 [Desulforamulus ruminis]|uniref:hypothetical protein n=1 Tax=Desulforamulus ruminis TaxID=1564 RepID=UPI002FDA0F05
MNMQEILNATDVRKDWGRFIDTVVREKPQMVKRNRDYFISFSLQQARLLLKDYHFNAQFTEEDDGSVTATLGDFDFVVNEKDQEAAIKALAEELVEYAKEYYDDFQLYFYSLNRQSHFPYVVAVLMEEDLDGVIGLIHA